MYRHSPADLITYYMLPREVRGRIPVRTGLGTRPSESRRVWVAVSAWVAPTLIPALLIAAVMFAILQSRLALWIAVSGAFGAGAMVVAIMNMFLDRFMFHKIIWLRHARCRPFRSGELNPNQLELLHKRQKPYLDHLAGKPAESLPGRGAPPHNILPEAALLSFTDPKWRGLLPETESRMLWFAGVIALAAGLRYLMFGAGNSLSMWPHVFQFLFTMVGVIAHSAYRERITKQILGMVQLQCPGCGHSLTNVGGEAGPRRCPECGSHWPLVPPPTPAELREIEKKLSS